MSRIVGLSHWTDCLSICVTHARARFVFNNIEFSLSGREAIRGDLAEGLLKQRNVSQADARSSMPPRE